jgi:hypothetical protein
LALLRAVLAANPGEVLPADNLWDRLRKILEENPELRTADRDDIFESIEQLEADIRNIRTDSR